MALPQRKYDLEELEYEAARPQRPRSKKGARILWWWVGIISICLVIWWVVWVWGGFGERWVHRYYREGTNGGAMSERMGQISDEPAADVTHSLGSTANPNTGVQGHSQEEDAISAEEFDGTAENPGPGDATENGAVEGSVGSATEPAPAAGAPPIL